MNIHRVNNMESLEVSLLGFIYQQPMHGYDLFKQISDLSGIGIVWHVKMGKLYSMLHRLEDNGWVSSKTTQEGNRPPRTQYAITKDGKKVFDGWVKSAVESGRDFRITFLLKLFFSMEKGKDVAHELITNQENACQNWLADFEERLTAVSDPEDFRKIVLNFRKSQINGYIDWLNWCKIQIIVEEK